MQHVCRLCQAPIDVKPVLEYPNAPAAAQGFRRERGSGCATVDLRLFECSACGLVQHDLPPVDYYRDVIRAIAVSQEMRGFRERQFHSWLAASDLTDRPILEVGCGAGEYLELLRRAGATSLFGLEHNHDNVLKARASGFCVEEGYLDDEFQPAWPISFDGFAIFSFLEHWPNPRQSLLRLNRLLTPGAKGIIEVPNFELILKESLYSEFTRDHILYFTDETLRSLLQLCGFVVESITAVWHGYILSAQVRKREAIDASAFKAKQHQISDEVNQWLKGFSPSEVAIWGAGHQALAVIALSELDQKVGCIIDSASFKQERYAPGSDLKVCAPNALRHACFQAVLVMAAAYSDEVVQGLRQNFPNIQHIAVLREQGLEIFHD